MSDQPDNPSAATGDLPPSAASKSPASKSQTTVLGDFELRKEIGRGGMGTVYEAWQRSLRRIVAVKVLGRQVGSSTTAVARFQREAQAAAKLHHPHIVPIFALGEEDGVFYYAMELIDGPGLNTIISETRSWQATDTATADLAETVPLVRDSNLSSAAKEGGNGDSSTDKAESPSVRTEVGGSVSTSSGLSGRWLRDSSFASAEYFATVAQHIASTADALDYAHRQGVIHRDIKPHNLMLGSDGEMRLADFGLARLAEQPGVTVTGELLGSPLYMSPEQIKGDSAGVDHRTDIYSLGATLYEWLALEPPYPGKTREQVISKILTSEPLPPTAHNPKIPTDLETICLKAIERDRQRRYQSAGELRDDLRRFVSDQPIMARRAGPATRIGKFIARHQLASVACAALVVAVTLGLTLIGKQREVKTQTAAAEQAKEETERLLDLFSMLPVEIGVPLRAAEAAVPMLESVVRGADDTLFSGGAVGDGANPARVSQPVRIARRAARDFFEAVAPAHWQARLASGKSGDSRTLLDRAIDSWSAKPDFALAFVDAHLDEHPNDYNASQLRAALRGRLGRYNEMLADAEDLAHLRPEEPNAYAWRALAHMLLENSERCLSDINWAVELRLPSPWIDALRGLALAQAERPMEAIAALDDALEREPDLIVALLGRAYGRAALGNVAGAVQDLTHALELEPDNADFLACRGDHYVKLAEFAAAGRDYERAMAIAGRTASMVLRYLSVLARQQGIRKSTAIGAGSPGNAGVGTGTIKTMYESSSDSAKGRSLRLPQPRSRDHGSSPSSSNHARRRVPPRTP